MEKINFLFKKVFLLLFVGLFSAGLFLGGCTTVWEQGIIDMKLRRNEESPNLVKINVFVESPSRRMVEFEGFLLSGKWYGVIVGVELSEQDALSLLNDLEGSIAWHGVRQETLNMKELTTFSLKESSIIAISYSETGELFYVREE